MFFNLLISTLILTNLFSEPLDLTPYKDTVSKKELIANKITEDTSQRLLSEQNLHLIGTNGRMMNEIEILGMDFSYFHEINLESARKLLITAIQSYLDAINNCKEVQPYLKNTPFTANNIRIGIWIYEPDGSNVPKNKLYYISAIKGELDYYLNDPKNYSRITFHQETYDEALKIIETSSEKSLSTKDPSKIPQTNITS